MKHRTMTLLSSISGLGMLLATAAMAQQPAAPDNTDTEVTSDNGRFIVSYETKLQPIVINRIHSWVFHVENAQGGALEDVQVDVVGGMPVHDHGLPTLPQATRHLGNGNYLMEGMKFHMNGWWQITVTVTAADATDKVTFDLVL